MRGLSGRAGWIGLAAFTVALWAQADALVGVFFDDGVYLSLARALAEGEGYRNIHLPGSPAGIHYPPLYPILVSLILEIWPAWPDQLVLVRLTNSLAFGGAVMLIAAHAERLTLARPVRTVAILLGATAFPLLTVVGVPFSEPLFLVLLGAAVLVSDTELDSPRNRFGWVLLGILLGLASLTRSIAVPLVITVALVWWLRGRRYESVGVVVTAALLLAPWFAWVWAHKGQVEPALTANYGSYFSEASAAGLTAFLMGLDLRVFHPVARLLFPVAGLGTVLAGLVVALLCIWGGVRLWREAPTLVAVLLVYLVVVTVWPFPPDRFVWVVLPWVFLLLSRAAVDLWNRHHLGRGAVALVVVASAAGFGRVQLISVAGRGFERAAVEISTPYRIILPTLMDELPVEAVVAADNEALIYLYSGRKAVPARPFRWRGRDRVALSSAKRLQFFCEQGVTHVVAFAHHDAMDRADQEGENAARLSELTRLRGGIALSRLSCSD